MRHDSSVSPTLNGACKRLLRYVRVVGSPQRVCVGTASMVGGRGGGVPELCVLKGVVGAWGGVRVRVGRRSGV